MPTIHQVAPLATVASGVGVALIEYTTQLTGERWGGLGITLIGLTCLNIAAFAWIASHVSRMSTAERHRVYLDQLTELVNGGQTPNLSAVRAEPFRRTN